MQQKPGMTDQTHYKCTDWSQDQAVAKMAMAEVRAMAMARVNTGQWPGLGPGQW